MSESRTIRYVLKARPENPLSKQALTELDRLLALLAEKDAQIAAVAAVLTAIVDKLKDARAENEELWKVNQSMAAAADRLGGE